jgi:hypothetical protein
MEQNLYWKVMDNRDGGTTEGFWLLNPIQKVVKEFPLF